MAPPAREYSREDITRAEKIASTRRKNREAERSEGQRLMEEGTRESFGALPVLLTHHLIIYRDSKGQGESSPGQR